MEPRRVISIIGGGPSISPPIIHSNNTLSYDMMVCNKAFIDFPDAQHLVFVDKKFGEYYRDKIIEIFKGIIYSPHEVKGLEVKKYLTSGVPTDDIVDGVFPPLNSGVAALSIAYLLGYNEIHLFGMDCCFSEDMKKTHYHDGYGSDYNPDPLQATPESEHNTHTGTIWDFRQLGEHIKDRRPDIKIYNRSNLSTIDQERKWSTYKDIEDDIDEVVN